MAPNQSPMAEFEVTVAYLSKLSGTSTQTIWGDVKLLWPLAVSMQKDSEQTLVERAMDEKFSCRVHSVKELE